MTLLASSAGRRLERSGNGTPRGMTAIARLHRCAVTEPGLSADFDFSWCQARSWHRSFPVTMTLRIGRLDIDVTFDGDIELART